ncbi:hypothetical protein DVS28_b0126 (plasmid) [Euzebya pacifica]|uniref:Uncharacterized protein n=1 Tax=Euzebya pacifica TaxID=1608957 RepID=A0A346Y5Z9_9ACTN|nr:hypothetical protein [Euzebya pacifica]AXV09896.1 hypothetical protein DVS28_b0126 [Euzebya pacifica]
MASKELSRDTAAILVGLVGRPDRLPFLDHRASLVGVADVAVGLAGSG